MAAIEIYNSSENKGCLLCGAKIVKAKSILQMRCEICGGTFDSSYHCTDMHYICENCSTTPPYQFIKNTCINYKGNDPIALAVEIMNSPIIKMRGPEHHFIVPAVLLTCIHNLTGNPADLIEKLDFTENRVKNEIQTNCTWSFGNCGAAIGTGIFLSVYENLKHDSDSEWYSSNSIIAQSLKRIAESQGPRCCKRDTYISLESAAEFLLTKYNINLSLSEGKCSFSLRNNSCGREDCEFYNIGFSIA
jgi:hypothetical protein